VIRALALGAATALLGSCGESQPLTVDKYLAQCESLKGKPVRLAGYLGTCGGYDCHLVSDPSHLNAFDRPWIGLGGSDAFDKAAAPFQNSYVVITGVVDRDSCTGEGGTDRSTGIEPTDIRSWPPSEGAPANTK
jgi:hypothetical protein